MCVSFIAQYIISLGGIGDGTRRELMKTVDIDLQGAIRNLDNLGVDLSSAAEKRKNKQSKERTEELKNRARDNELSLMRYVPQLHSVIEQLVQGTLKEDQFPYTSPPPPGSAPAAAASAAGAGAAARKGVSARKRPNGADWKSGGDSASSSSAAAAAPAMEEDVRPRFIVFVLGGLTFSEMRSCYEIADKYNANLLIGSTSTLTPTEYIRDLANLNDDQFKQAVLNSQQYSQTPAAGAAAAGAGGRSGAASSGAAGGGSAIAMTRRGASANEDSDDDEPINLHKLNVNVRK